MNRTPRNAGQSFSGAADGSVVVVTEEVIIVVIDMVDIAFAIVQTVSHIATVWLLFDASLSAAAQLVVFCCSHVRCVKINRNSTVSKVNGTSFASYSEEGGYSLKYRKIPKISPSMYKPLQM